MISKIDPNDLTLKQLFDQFGRNSRAKATTETAPIQPAQKAFGSKDQRNDEFGGQSSYEANDSEQGQTSIANDLNQLLISVVDEIE